MVNLSTGNALYNLETWFRPSWLDVVWAQSFLHWSRSMCCESAQARAGVFGQI